MQIVHARTGKQRQQGTEQVHLGRLQRGKNMRLFQWNPQVQLLLYKVNLLRTKNDFKGSLIFFSGVEKMCAVILEKTERILYFHLCTCEKNLV